MPDGLPESMLVATDLSAHGARVLAAAAGLAHAFGAELRVIHALDLSGQAYLPDAPLAPSFPARLAETVRQLDGQVRRTCIHPDVRVSRQVVIRSPAKAILELATTGFDLIVLGAHIRVGRPPTIGSTVNEVVAQSRIPCLVVGPRAELPIMRMTVAHDFPRHGRPALERTTDWTRAKPARQAGGSAPKQPAAVRLDVVHVTTPTDSDAQIGRSHALLARDIGVMSPAPQQSMDIQSVIPAADPMQGLSGFPGSDRAGLRVRGGAMVQSMENTSQAMTPLELATRGNGFILLVPSPPAATGQRVGKTIREVVAH